MTYRGSIFMYEIVIKFYISNDSLLSFVYMIIVQYSVAINLQNCLNQLHEWCSKWLMELNIKPKQKL